MKLNKEKHNKTKYNYTEYSEYPTKKLLELINKVSKVAGCKINLQKSVAFLHTNIKQSEKKIRNTIPFTVASKTIEEE